MIVKHNQSSTSIPWDLIADDSSQPTPPPQKRIKSVELYKKQHGLTDDQLMPRDHVSIQQHALRRERDKSKDSRERDRSLEMKESLLSQALEGGPTLTIPSQVRVAFLRLRVLFIDVVSFPLITAFRFTIAASAEHRRGLQQQRHGRIRRWWWPDGRPQRLHGSLAHAVLCQLLPRSSKSTRPTARPIRHARQFRWVPQDEIFSIFSAFINKFNKESERFSSFSVLRNNAGDIK